MSVKTIGGNLLFWKITAVFTTLLIVLGLIFVSIASRSSKSFYTSAHQQLYGDIAHHLATVTQPFKNGRPDTTVTHDIIHSTMVANPSVEVYLVDTAGYILDYVVPESTVHMRRLNISVIKQWLRTNDGNYPMGDNPKVPAESSIFSAAPAFENGRVVGYVYAVLASEKQKEILTSLSDHLHMRLGTYIFFTALLVAFVVGVMTFFLITDSICDIASTVRRFKEGDYSARIDAHSKGNLGILTSTFNEMADVIVSNFEKITATEKFRKELIANVSHDLRTPLSIMQGYIETLMIKNDTLTRTDQEKYLTIVHDGTKKLSALVQQLFQYAKLEANVITPEKELFLINELASDILMTYQLKAAERIIQLKLDAPNTLAPVFADIALTERVLQNLIDNAFNFTAEGGQITISLTKVSSGVKVQVVDTGIGIAPEDHAFIFQRYIQLGDTPVPRRGMGIGLAIVKKILELHQSAIEVTSEPGKGTSFRFTLPIVNKAMLVAGAK
jgi:signal transduction histidine kinase